MGYLTPYPNVNSNLFLDRRNVNFSIRNSFADCFQIQRVLDFYDVNLSFEDFERNYDIFSYNEEDDTTSAEHYFQSFRIQNFIILLVFSELARRDFS